MGTTQAIPYKEVMRILEETKDPRAQALLAFQYTSAARVGEMIAYTHKYRDGSELTTEGILKSTFDVQENKITWRIPNFKKTKKTINYKYPFVLKAETTLWNTILAWLITANEQVFEIREGRARQIIRHSLRPFGYEAGDIKNILRHSRATHLAEAGWSAYAITKALGHSRLDTALFYVNERDSEDKLLKYVNPLQPKEVT